jgi:hypothetical protein
MVQFSVCILQKTQRAYIVKIQWLILDMEKIVDYRNNDTEHVDKLCGCYAWQCMHQPLGFSKGITNSSIVLVIVSIRSQW